MIRIQYSFCDVLDTYDKVVVGLYKIASNINDKSGTLISTCVLADDARGKKRELSERGS